MLVNVGPAFRAACPDAKELLPNTVDDIVFVTQKELDLSLENPNISLISITLIFEVLEKIA